MAPSGSTGGILFFTATTPASGRELWRSDGSPGGTFLVADILPGVLSSIPANLTRVGNRLFFTVSSPGIGNELWVTDDLEREVMLVRDLVPGAASSNPGNLTNVDGTLFFTATTPATGVELWRSDGTADGTVLVRDINSGSASSSPIQLTNVAGMLYFVVSTLPATGSELWKSDGTAAGTVLVRDINPGAASSNPALLTDVHGTLFFVATDPVNGRELWTSDGTTAGTRLVLDINPGSASAFVASPARTFAPLRGRLFFVADDGFHGAEPWITTGLAVENVVIDDGSAQRSRVASITITFSDAVTIDADAFELREQGGGLIDLDVVTFLVDGKTVAVLTFRGEGVTNGSLNDGRYTLTIGPERVHDDQGQTLAFGRLDRLHRLFGDGDGDGDVDFTDLVHFRSAFGGQAGEPGYLPYFDFDDDGVIDLTDYAEFRRRLGTSL